MSGAGPGGAFRLPAPVWAALAAGAALLFWIANGAAALEG